MKSIHDSSSALIFLLKVCIFNTFILKQFSFIKAFKVLHIFDRYSFTNTTYSFWASFRSTISDIITFISLSLIDIARLTMSLQICAGVLSDDKSLVPVSKIIWSASWFRITVFTRSFIQLVFADGWNITLIEYLCFMVFGSSKPLTSFTMLSPTMSTDFFLILILRLLLFLLFAILLLVLS